MVSKNKGNIQVFANIEGLYYYGLCRPYGHHPAMQIEQTGICQICEAQIMNADLSCPSSATSVHYLTIAHHLLIDPPDKNELTPPAAPRVMLATLQLTCIQKRMWVMLKLIATTVESMMRLRTVYSMRETLLHHPVPESSQVALSRETPAYVPTVRVTYGKK